MAKQALTKNQMIQVLTDKGIEFDSKMSKDQIEEIYQSKAKKIVIGNRTGTFYFGTRENTMAGEVCRAIALKKVKSTLDIRKMITSKYSFSETLNRLEVEGIIKRDGKAFELTPKGLELAAQYKARFEN